MMPTRTRRQHGALVVEAAHQHVHAAPLLPQDVLRRHLAILEHEFAGVRSAHAELVQLLRGGETFHALFDQERRDALRSGLRVGLRVHDQRVRVGAVGDPHLVAVQHVTLGRPAALPVRAQAHRHDVRTRPRFAHRQRADVLAADELRQVALLLRFAAVAADLVDAKVRMRAVGQSHRRGRARDLLHRDDVGEVSHRRAAVLFLDGDAEQSQVAHLPPQVGRKEVVVIDGRGARRDLVGGELLHGRAQHVDRLAVVEVEGRKIEHCVGLPKATGPACRASPSASAASAPQAYAFRPFPRGLRRA